MIKLVLLRHGESVWNKKGLFTGWTDVGLTSKGILEGKLAGQGMLNKKFTFDVAFTSYLKRASKTLELVLQEMGLVQIKRIADWRLNERHYGDLQGLNKQEVAKKFGEKQVLIWRRSYSVRPPEIKKSNPYNQRNDKCYHDILVPKAESLRDVTARVIPFWREEVVPRLKKNEKIIIAASGNSLRALVKYLDKISAKEISNLNIPTGVPLVYELDKDFKPIRHYYLADKKSVQQKINSVKMQGVINK